MCSSGTCIIQVQYQGWDVFTQDKAIEQQDNPCPARKHFSLDTIFALLSALLLVCRVFTSFLSKPLLFHACVIMHSTSCHSRVIVPVLTHSRTVLVLTDSTDLVCGSLSEIIIRALGEGGYCIMLYFVLGDVSIMTLSCCFLV